MLFSHMGCCPTGCQAGCQVGLVLGVWRISRTQRSNSPCLRAVEVAWGSVLAPAPWPLPVSRCQRPGLGSLSWQVAPWGPSVAPAAHLLWLKREGFC